MVATEPLETNPQSLLIKQPLIQTFSPKPGGMEGVFTGRCPQCRSCDNMAANRYWLLECKDIFTAGNFHIVPGRTHKASAGVAGVVPAVLLGSPHTADLDPEDN